MKTLLDEIEWKVDFIHANMEWSIFLDVSLSQPLSLPPIWLDEKYTKVRMIGNGGNLHVVVPGKPGRVFVSYNGGDLLTLYVNDKEIEKSQITKGFDLQQTSGTLTLQGNLDDINHIVVWDRYVPKFSRRMFGSSDERVNWKRPVPRKREPNEFYQRAMRE